MLSRIGGLARHVGAVRGMPIERVASMATLIAVIAVPLSWNQAICELLLGTIRSQEESTFGTDGSCKDHIKNG